MSDSILNEGGSAPVESSTAEPVAQEAPAVATESATTEAPAVETSVADVNFLDSLSEDLRGEANLKDFKDVNGLAKSYVNAQQLLGKSLRIPSDDASPEAKQEFLTKLKDIPGVLLTPNSDEEKTDFLNKLGRPAEASQYSLNDIIPEEIADMPNLNVEIEDFKSIAFDAGLTDEQAKILVGMRMNTIKQQQESQLALQEASIQELKKTWGADYENRLNGAKQMAKIYSEKFPESMESLINSPAGNNPALLNMLSEMAVTFKEGGHAGMAQTEFGTTPEQAKDKISEKRADKGFMKAYTDSLNPNHQAAVQELSRLYKLSVGG